MHEDLLAYITLSFPWFHTQGVSRTVPGGFEYPV